jgi:hypothetical protein
MFCHIFSCAAGSKMPSSSPLRMLGGADSGKRLPPGETAKEVTLVLTDVQVCENV